MNKKLTTAVRQARRALTSVGEAFSLYAYSDPKLFRDFRHDASVKQLKETLAVLRQTNGSEQHPNARLEYLTTSLQRLLGSLNALAKVWGRAKGAKLLYYLQWFAEQWFDAWDAVSLMELELTGKGSQR